MIASPDDMGEAVAVVEASVHGWNDERAERELAVLLPMRWETRAVPLLGFKGAQPVINAQLLERADILIALFGTRAGTPTAAARSGTVEEIDKALERGLPVHVYFSSMPMAHDVDVDALNQVRQLERELRERGLTGRFGNLTQLRDAVRSALESDMTRLSSESIAGFETSAVLLRVVGQWRSEPEAVLVITNDGARACVNLRVKITHSSRDARVLMGNTRFNLEPGESTRLQVVGAAAGERVRVHLDWREADSVREEEAIVVFAEM